MRKQILTTLVLIVLAFSALCIPVRALTEDDVESAVSASSKEEVTGNVLIWFLCAVAFLKVSQKIDSFMGTLGVNVGHTGGSMLADAMIAMRTITMVAGGKGRASRAGPVSSGTAGKSDTSGMTGFFKGGLVGIAGRHITNSAVKTATTQTSAVHTAQSQVKETAAANVGSTHTSSDTLVNSETHSGSSSILTEHSLPTGTPPQEGIIVGGGSVSTQAAPVESPLPVNSVFENCPPQEGVILTGSEPPPSIPPADAIPPETIPSDVTPPQDGVVITGGDTTIHAPQAGTEGAVGEQHTQVHTERVQTSHTAATSERARTSRFHMFETSSPTLGGMVFSHSLQSGGSFANDVIGTVARGEVAGSITGDMAAQSLISYMGSSAPSVDTREISSYSGVEIGYGRIIGTETSAGASEGRSFAMYHVDQYTAPSGEYSKVVSADGTQWYKQYAQDAVERKPYMAPDDTVAYHERIIKKLPDPPKRKDRI